MDPRGGALSHLQHIADPRRCDAERTPLLLSRRWALAGKTLAGRVIDDGRRLRPSAARWIECTPNSVDRREAGMEDFVNGRIVGEVESIRSVEQGDAEGRHSEVVELAV